MQVFLQLLPPLQVVLALVQLCLQLANSGVQLGDGKVAFSALCLQV
jgi:hypothetical protein